MMMTDIEKRRGLGIPDPEAYGDVTKLPTGISVPLFVQEHAARRAGLHKDIRFGPEELFSWATRKGFPKPGERFKWFQQPLHEHAYGSYVGPLTGYGAGEVKSVFKDSIFLTSVQPDKISFVSGYGRFPQRYTLIRSPKKPKEWLVLNTTPRRPEDILAKDLPKSVRQAREALGLDKEKYRSLPAEKVENLYDENATFSEKIDGAAALFKILKDRIEAISYRVSKTGQPIIHTERMKLPVGVSIPPHIAGTILRGEIYGERTPTDFEKLSSAIGFPIPSFFLARDDLFEYLNKRAEEAISSQELGGILNAALVKALQRQEERNIRLRAAIFNLRTFGKEMVPPEMPYPERVKKLEEVLKYLPSEIFHLPRMATKPVEQKKLWEDIVAGRNLRTREGVVVFPQIGPATKVKILPEFDVHITRIFPGKGRLEGKAAGGFAYSLEPGGKEVGEVGTGLSDDLRQDLWENQEEYIGRTARVKAMDKYPSGALRAPALISIHEDYPTSI